MECLFLWHIEYLQDVYKRQVYNDATAQVWRNGEWQTMEDTSCGALLPVEVIYEVPGPVEAAA